MKHLIKLGLIALSGFTLVGNLSALTVENNSASNAPFHVRVFPDEQSFRSWAIGRGLGEAAVIVLTSAAEVDLEKLKTKGEAKIERNVDAILDRAAKAQGWLKTTFAKQLRESHLEKRAVDYMYQLAYKHVDPGAKFSQNIAGYPLGVFLVITPHGSRIPLVATDVLEPNKYSVTIKKEKDSQGKEKYEIKLDKTGYKIGE